MSILLHLSDFHFGKNPVVEESRLLSLAQWLNNQSIKIDYLIFTGDIVDARAITKKCVQEIIKLFPEDYEDVDIKEIDNHIDTYILRIKKNGIKHIDEYNRCLKSYYIDEMNNAKNIFISFVRLLKIAYDRIIICCGNHDRLRLLKMDDVLFECDNNCICEDNFIEDFSPYKEFCEKINNKISFYTNVYKHDGFNFVIANSNWKVPYNNESNNMCIHCNKLVEVLTDIKKQADFNRNKTIFIAHKPFDDICENVKFPYEHDQTITLQQMVERTACMFLYGDKHSYNVKLKNELKEFMCGHPISYDNVRYNLIDLDTNNGSCSCKYIFKNKEGWGMVPVTDCSEEVYDISKEYLKKQAFSLLNNSKEISSDFDQVVAFMRECIANKKINLISQVFSSFITIRNKDNKKITLEDDDVFEYLFNLIQDTSTHRSISIKGSPGMGKNTLLTIEYLYMLLKFYNGTSKYIPFYFDADVINKKYDKKDTVNDFICRKQDIFSSFLDKCFTISQIYKLPICLFVSGLQKENMLSYTGETLESMIYETLEDKFDNNENKYVMCLHIHNTVLFDNTFDQQNRFEFVVFFNSVRIIPYKNIEKSETLLKSYLQIKGNGNESQIDDFKEKLKKLRKTSIDFNFVHQHYKFINDIDINETPWQIMKNEVRFQSEIAYDLFGARKIKNIQKVAYLLLYQGKTFQEIMNTGMFQEISLLDFIKICDNLDVTEYLIADYFVRELINCSHEEEAIPKDSILYCFFPRDLSIMIRIIIDNKTDCLRVLNAFIDKHKNELTGFLLSTIIYIAGHIKTGNNLQLINKLVSIKNENSSAFFELCHIRSLKLAQIVCTNNINYVNEFVCVLMDDELFRRFNRSYQLKYYQDIPNATGNPFLPWDEEVSKQSGFDFYNCFFVLVSKLDFSFHLGQPYPMMIIDLFTICDLIYSRMQNMNSEGALFYSANYNKKGDSVAKNILLKTNKLISEYLNNTQLNQSYADRANAYFTFMQKKFKEIIEILDKNTDKNLTVPLVSHHSVFDSVLNFHKMPRVGWNINHAGQVKVEDQPKYDMNSSENESNKNSENFVFPHETIMQHIIETLYIAQLFLPPNIDLKGYDKSTIISLILLSELGKTSIGDYSPDYSNALRRYIPNEQKQLTELLILGAIDGYANNGVYYESLIKGNFFDEFDINMHICKDLKLIQMEYKYYSLYEELNFDDERRQVFEKEFVEPSTTICTTIRKMLIRDNPKFKKFFNL